MFYLGIFTIPTIHYKFSYKIKHCTAILFIFYYISFKKFFPNIFYFFIFLFFYFFFIFFFFFFFKNFFQKFFYFFFFFFFFFFFIFFIFFIFQFGIKVSKIIF